MDTNDTPTNGRGKSDDIIDDLYGVAIDPTRYESLLDHWEAMIQPQRAAADPDDFSVIRLDHLSGHVNRADQILDTVIRDVEDKSPQAMLARMTRVAAFAADRSGRVIAANPAATALLDLSVGQVLTTLALGIGDADQLAKTVGRMLGANHDAPVVLRARTAQTERLIVFQLRVVRKDVVRDDIMPEDRQAPFVIVISSHMRWPDGFSDMLRAAFDLTPAETDVVRALTEGQTLHHIADARGRSVDTIRAQLKSVMAKTETRSQTELVCLTLSTMEIAQFTTQVSDRVAKISRGYETLKPRPFQTLTLPDGRRMDYLILGDPKGAPLFYLPLDYGLTRWPASAENAAIQRGIRIIVPVRAGYGASTPLPKHAPYVSSLVNDFAALLDHLGVSQAPFLSLGDDSHLAMEFNAAHPNRMTALVACAGVLPLTQAAQYERMDKWHRFILAGARYTPHLLPFMVKGGFALAKRLGKRGFIHAVYGKSPADVATFELPEVFEAIVCGSEVCLSDTHSAHDAFSREVIAHETTDWIETVMVLKDKVPVIFMNGLQDPQVPPDTLADFRSDYPWIDFQVYPDAGQLLFFLKWPEVLERLGPFLGKR